MRPLSMILIGKIKIYFIFNVYIQSKIISGKFQISNSSFRTMQESQDYVYKIHETFSRCSGGSSDDMRTCATELTMFTTVTLLFIGEILQFLSLGPYTSFSELRFYFNFDNFIQIIVISLAAASLVVQNEEHLEKWISAFGIVFAYIGNNIEYNDLILRHVYFNWHLLSLLLFYTF